MVTKVGSRRAAGLRCALGTMPTAEAGLLSGVFTRLRRSFPKHRQRGEDDMPRKPKTPCRYPGCAALCEGRYCEEHSKLEAKHYERWKRDTQLTRQRYGAEWRRIRKAYISTHPMCEMCLEGGRFVPATEVHHKVPLGDGGTHAATNLMALCKPCHSRITAEMGDRWAKRTGGGG